MSKISGYLPILLQMIAPKMSINLSFERISTGATDGKKVVISNSVLSMADQDKAEKMALGLLCHEGLGHVRQTSWTDWNAFCKKNPEGRQLLNVVEDARIERRAWMFYPGTKSMLHDVCDVLVQDGLLKFPEADCESGEALIMGLLHVLRGEFLDQPMNPVGARKLLTEKFGQPLASEIITLAFEGANAESTGLAIIPVLKILDLLKQQSQSKQNKEEKSPPEQNQKNGDDEGGGEDGANDEQSQEQQGKDGGGQNSESDSNPGDKQQSSSSQSAPSEQQDNAAKALQDMLDDKVPSADLGEVIQQEVEQENDSNPSSGSTPIYDKIPTIQPGDAIRVPGTEVLAASRRMSAKLEQLMVARTEDEDCVTYSGELEGNLVSRVRLLDTQIFRQDGDEMEGIDSAILLLLDASGSMSDSVSPGVSRATLCFNAAWAASSAMAKFKTNGVEMAIWSYGSKLTKFVDFGGWNHQKDRFKRYDNEGGTATFPACVEGTGELAKQKQKRKHLVLFSDGDLGGAITEKYLLEAIKAGIEVSIIFIGDKGTKPSGVSLPLGHRVYVVHDTDSIVQAMFSCLKPR